MQQEIKVDLLHTVYKHCLHSKAHIYLHTQEGCHHICTYFMNLHCFFYTPVKTRSLYHSSLECSNGSNSTYFTQSANIAYIQRLIPPHSRGVSPHIYIFYESALLLLHAGENQKSVSFVIRVQQRIKVDLLHSVNKNRPTSTPYSSKTNGGVTPHKCCLNEAPMLLLWCNPSPKSVGHCVMELQAFKVTLFW